MAIVDSKAPFIPSERLIANSSQPFFPVFLLTSFILLKKSFIPLPILLPSPSKLNVVIAPKAVSIAALTLEAIVLKYCSNTPVSIAVFSDVAKLEPSVDQSTVSKNTSSASKAAFIELPTAVPSPGHPNFPTTPFSPVPRIEAILLSPSENRSVCSLTQFTPLLSHSASAPPISLPSPVSHALVNKSSIFRVRVSTSLCIFLNALFHLFS